MVPGDSRGDPVGAVDVRDLRTLSPALLADQRVRIPVAPDSDSLNVAAATAVLLYALAR